MKPRKSGLSTQGLILISVLLLLCNMFLSVFLRYQTEISVTNLIHERMLDIANTAAGMLNGDELETLTAQDRDTPAYQNALKTLAAFQEHIELRYIYGIRDMGDKRFTFTIDPTVLDPAEFGQPVVYTDALYQASLGTPAADDTPYVDDWGRFYSAYSPVFNSAGKVAGIVGVDFSADWFDRQISVPARAIAVISVVSLLVGVAIMLIITSRFRKKFSMLRQKLYSLAGDVEALTHAIRTEKGQHADDPAEDAASPSLPLLADDEIEELGEKIRSMQTEVRDYISFVQAQAYTDPMTGAGSRQAYAEAVQRQEKKIQENRADFALAIFDINSLKTINDNFGHEHGDQIIADAAAVIRKVFGAGQVFRIGGDEFIAVMEKTTLEQAETLLAALEEEIAILNRRERPEGPALAISSGAAVFRPNEDTEYKTVFKRADETMYRNKAAYYMRFGDRRKH